MTTSLPISFGRYEVVERLAVGGMAEILLAHVCGPHGFEKPVVIKRLLPHLATDERFNAMFVDEAKLTSRLVHPKIVQTYELGRYAGQLYMTMEYVDGLDCLALLRECAYRAVLLPQELCAYIAGEVLDALDFAHNQAGRDGRPLELIHRDISPSNVLLSRRGDVKLVDFGIARAAEQDHRTQSGTLKGKYGYMSPEQVLGRPLDARSDLFSTAVVFAELLMGRRLFAAPSELDVLLMVRDARLDRLDRFGEHIDPDLVAILRRAMRKDPNERFRTAVAFRTAIEEWASKCGHRVTCGAIADVVAAFRDQARERRRRSLPGQREAADLPSSEAAEVAGELVAGDEHAVVEEIPAATSRHSDSFPVVVVETESGAVATPASRVGARGSAEGEASRTGAAAAVASGRPAPSQPDARDGATPQAVPEEETTRWPAHAAQAMAGTAPQDQDPAAVDFDGTEVSAPETRPSVNRSPRRRLFTPAAGIALERDGDVPDDRGDLAHTGPIRVLYRLAVAKATGLLVVTVGGICKEIYYFRGTPEYVASNVGRELFGEYLVRHNSLSEGELAMALAMMPHYGGKLGDTLVGLGLMTPLEVFRMLTRQVYDKLVDVCTWTKGSFAWYEGRQNLRDAFPLDLNPFSVLGAGGRSLNAGAVVSWAESQAATVLASRENPHLSPEDFHLGAAAREAYNALDGSKTLRQWQEHYAVDHDRLRFLRLAYLFTQTDLAAPI